MNASVIIPVFNGEQTIKPCIESLINQTFGESYEIIVVDDGSTDETKDVVKSFDSKITYLFQKNKGPAIARNAGAKNAKFEILVFIDADCIAEKNWLNEMVRPFKNKEIVGVQGRYKTMQKSLTARFVQIEIEERYEKMKKHENIDFIGSYSAAYRKEIFIGTGGFDESFPIASGEDPELAYKLAKKGEKLVFNENAVVYHKHPESLLKYLQIKFFRAYWRVLLYSRHKDKIINDSYTPQALKFQIIFTTLTLLSLVGWGLKILPLWLFGTFLGVLGLSFMPFILFTASKDLTMVAPIIPVLFTRNIVFGLGLILGLLSGVWKK
ncbi:MAG: glycosyltransferase [Candidatus Diapherotrites archaeon]